MAFKILGDDRDRSDVLVVSGGDELLTSLTRQDQLLATGYLFEAAVSQAALVEGLLLHYLMLAKSRGFALSTQTKERFGRGRITFGQIKDELVTLGAFHDSALALTVPQYVESRNRIAHHLTSGMHDFDFHTFYSDGRAIALSLWHHILDETADRRKALP